MRFSTQILWFLGIFLWNNAAVFAQTETDSLLAALPKVQDTAKIRIYKYLCYKHFRNDFGVALRYGREGIALARKQQRSKDEAYLLDMIGSLYAHYGDFTTGLDYKLKGLRLYERINDQDGISQLNNNLGVLYFRQKKYENALKHYQEALRIAREAKDTKAECIYLLNIGEVYEAEGAYKEALEYEFASLRISEAHNLADDYAYANGIIGKVYEAQKNYLEALNYYQKALDIFVKLDEREAIAEYFLYKARVYFKAKQYGNALKNANKSLIIADETKSMARRSEAYGILAEVQAAQGDFVKSYASLRQHTILKDSMLNESATRHEEQLRAIYETEKKQHQIDSLTQQKRLQQDEIERRNLWLGIVVVVASLLVLVGILLYRNNRHKQKLNTVLIYKNEEINQQKEEIRTQRDNLIELNAEIQTKSDEIQKINTDLLASIAYAKRIQDAMLPFRERINTILSNYFIFYRPRDIVSGDFYWIQSLEEEQKVIIAVADCTGHGVPGALMSMIGNQLLYDVVMVMGITNPAEILAEMNQEIVRVLKQNQSDNRDGMEVALITIDYAAKEVLFAGAGCPLVWIQGGELHTIKGSLLSVGGHNKAIEKNFVQHTISLTTDTYIYMFSDGLQDQFGGEQNKKFTQKRLREVLLANHQESFDIQEQILARTYQDWVIDEQHHRQIDDILVMGLKIDV